MKLRHLGPIVMTATLLMACGRENDSVAGPASVGALSTQLGIFEAAWPKRSPVAIGHRTHKIAEIITGQSRFSEDEFSVAVAGQSTTASWMLEPVSGLLVTYHPQHDVLRVDDMAVAKDYTEGDDIGEAEALKVFHNTFKSLATEGIVEDAHFDLTKVDVAYGKAGAAPFGQVAKQYVTSYIFTALRQINGIPFANAGVRVAIHRSGRVAWIRLGGAEIASNILGTIEVPTGSGSMFARTVADSEITARFTREKPNGSVEWSRVMYALSDRVSSALIEPKQVISHELVFKSDGHDVVSRRQLLAYSLRDGAAAAEDLGPVPNPNTKGDQRP